MARKNIVGVTVTTKMTRLSFDTNGKCQHNYSDNNDLLISQDVIDEYNLHDHVSYRSNIDGYKPINGPFYIDRDKKLKDGKLVLVWCKGTEILLEVKKLYSGNTGEIKQQYLLYKPTS